MGDLKDITKIAAGVYAANQLADSARKKAEEAKSREAARVAKAQKAREELERRRQELQEIENLEVEEEEELIKRRRIWIALSQDEQNEYISECIREDLDLILSKKRARSMLANTTFDDEYGIFKAIVADWPGSPLFDEYMRVHYDCPSEARDFELFLILEEWILSVDLDEENDEVDFLIDRLRWAKKIEKINDIFDLKLNEEQSQACALAIKESKSIMEAANAKLTEIIDSTLAKMQAEKAKKARAEARAEAREKTIAELERKKARGQMVGLVSSLAVIGLVVWFFKWLITFIAGL